MLNFDLWHDKDYPRIQILTVEEKRPGVGLSIVRFVPSGLVLCKIHRLTSRWAPEMRKSRAS
jgi:hypothetical protein